MSCKRSKLATNTSTCTALTKLSPALQSPRETTTTRESVHIATPNALHADVKSLHSAVHERSSSAGTEDSFVHISSRGDGSPDSRQSQRLSLSSTSSDVVLGAELQDFKDLVDMERGMREQGIGEMETRKVLLEMRDRRVGEREREWMERLQREQEWLGSKDLDRESLKLGKERELSLEVENFEVELGQMEGSRMDIRRKEGESMIGIMKGYPHWRIKTSKWIKSSENTGSSCIPEVPRYTQLQFSVQDSSIFIALNTIDRFHLMASILTSNPLSKLSGPSPYD